MNHNIYVKRKGVQSYGSKTWAITDKEKIWLYIVMTVCMLIFAAVMIAMFLSIPASVKALILVVGVISFLLILGVFMTVVILKHHHEDPIEMHYYDVDYEVNHITGKGYDNTVEISKEEFNEKPIHKKDIIKSGDTNNNE